MAKYTYTGQGQWVTNPISGPEGNQAYTLIIGSSGNLFISGWFTSPSVNFGGINLTGTSFTDNIFLAEYDPNGNVKSAQSFTGSGLVSAYGNDLCADFNGNIYMTGYFEGGKIQFGNTTLTNTGSWDVYWTKIGYGSGLGLAKIDAQNIQIYPNPSNDGMIHISGIQEEYAVKVINMMGEIVYQQEHVLGEKILHLSQREAGMYLIQIQVNGGIISKKVIISTEK